MAFEPDFLTMMPYTVRWTSVVGYDAFDQPIYDDETRLYRCRITGKFLPLRMPMSQDSAPIFDIYLGAEVMDDGTLEPIGDDVFGPDDKLEMPPGAEWIDGTPEIFAIGRNTDQEGHHHVKVQCGWKYHRQGQ